MAYFIIRVLVNALALAVTLTVFPWINIKPVANEQLAATYIVLGLLFGVINAFVRPIVLFLTARLLITTMGLFMIVINAFLFWLLSVILPQAFDIRSPEVVWVTLGSVFVGIVVTVMEAVFGLDSPISSVGQGRFYWRWLDRLSPGRRNVVTENLRIAQISETVARYTKDIAVDFTPLERMRMFMQGLLYGSGEVAAEHTLPAKVRLLLQSLGPTFVKFGQVVSSRAEQLPAEWRDELAKLQSNVEPISASEARRIVHRELSAPVEQLYATFDEKPLAAASTATVFNATLKDGERVVVKVQRPDIDVTVKADLNVMRDLANDAQRKREWARELDIAGTLNEFADNVLRELDYRNEALNANLLAHNMGEFEFVHVPKVYLDLSARRVMTQEFVKGIKITNAAALDESGVDRTLMAQQFIRAMVKQVLFDGFFHGDPHPGNILIDPVKNQIIFLDMGMMGELNKQQRMALGDLIWALYERDGYEIAKTARNLSTPFKEVDEDAFIDDVERLMKRYTLASGGSVNMGAVMNEMISTMRRAGLRLDSRLTLALKSLFQAEQAVRALDPSLSMVNAAFEQVKSLLREQFDPQEIAQMVRKQAMRSAKEVIRRIPTLQEAAVKWLDQFQRGRFTVYVDTSDVAKEVDKIDAALSRNMTLLALSLIISGLLVGAAIATSLDVEPFGIPLKTIAFLLFLGAAGVAAYIVLRTVRRVL